MSILIQWRPDGETEWATFTCTEWEEHLRVCIRPVALHLKEHGGMARVVDTRGDDVRIIPIDNPALAEVPSHQA